MNIKELPLNATVLVNISLDEAKTLLMHTRQRPLKRPRVEKINKIHREGRWNPFVGSEVRFDVNDNVIAGQHRLTSQCEMKVPCVKYRVLKSDVDTDAFFEAEAEINSGWSVQDTLRCA